MPQGLPPNWVEEYSKTRQRVYYFNTVTNESVWERPTNDTPSRHVQTYDVNRANDRKTAGVRTDTRSRVPSDRETYEVHRADTARPGAQNDHIDSYVAQRTDVRPRGPAADYYAQRIKDRKGPSVPTDAHLRAPNYVDNVKAGHSEVHPQHNNTRTLSGYSESRAPTEAAVGTPHKMRRASESVVHMEIDEVAAESISAASASERLKYGSQVIDANDISAELSAMAPHPSGRNVGGVGVEAWAKGHRDLSVSIHGPVYRRLNIVVDTNVLLSNLAAIEALGYMWDALAMAGLVVTIVIPWIVIHELDGLKQRTTADHDSPSAPSIGTLARHATRFLHDNLAVGAEFIVAQGMTHDRSAKALVPMTNDERVLACCLALVEDNANAQAYAQSPHPIAVVVLLTDDRNLSVKALASSIPALGSRLFPTAPEDIMLLSQDPISFQRQRHVAAVRMAAPQMSAGHVMHSVGVDRHAKSSAEPQWMACEDSEHAPFQIDDVASFVGVDDGPRASLGHDDDSLLHMDADMRNNDDEFSRQQQQLKRTRAKIVPFGSSVGAATSDPSSATGGGSVVSNISTNASVDDSGQRQRNNARLVPFQSGTAVTTKETTVELSQEQKLPQQQQQQHPQQYPQQQQQRATRARIVPTNASVVQHSAENASHAPAEPQHSDAHNGTVRASSWAVLTRTLSEALSPAIEYMMAKAYGHEDWMELVTVQPPWTGRGCLHVLQHHHIAVFKDYVRDGATRDAIKEMEGTLRIHDAAAARGALSISAHALGSLASQAASVLETLVLGITEPRGARNGRYPGQHDSDEEISPSHIGGDLGSLRQLPSKDSAITALTRGTSTLRTLASSVLEDEKRLSTSLHAARPSTLPMQISSQPVAPQQSPVAWRVHAHTHPSPMSQTNNARHVDSQPSSAPGTPRTSAATTAVTAATAIALEPTAEGGVLAKQFVSVKEGLTLPQSIADKYQILFGLLSAEGAAASLAFTQHVCETYATILSPYFDSNGCLVAGASSQLSTADLAMLLTHVAELGRHVESIVRCLHAATCDETCSAGAGEALLVDSGYATAADIARDKRTTLLPSWTETLSSAVSSMTTQFASWNCNVHPASFLLLMCDATHAPAVPVFGAYAEALLNWLHAVYSALV
eukprot:Opistho-2@29776